MEKNRLAQQLLNHVLFSSVSEQQPGVLPENCFAPEVWAEAYRLAKKHDVAHILSGYVYRNKISVPTSLESALKQEELVSVYRYTQIQHAFGEICSVFEDVKIPYIPLKGSVIRPYYPEERMRTSCDIDILIHEESLSSAIDALQRKGYRCGERNYHDVSLYSPGNVHLELHFNIQENIDTLDVVLKKAWQYAAPVDGYRYAFGKEFFVFYMYAHMAYHFLSGGCGLRALMDLWVVEHRMEAPCHCAEALLKQAGIRQFAAQMSDIANRLVTGEPLDSFACQVMQYVYAGGVYGSKENNLTVSQNRSNGKLRYWIKRAFPSRKSMTNIYPALKKAPYLLPLFWGIRWITRLFGGGARRLASEVACVTQISFEKMAQVKEIYEGLGL